MTNNTVKKISILAIIVIASIFFSFPAKADKYCKEVAEVAKITMIARQTGVSIVDTLQKVQGTKDQQELLTEIIIMAYKKPRYLGKKAQNRSITEFENMVYLTCIKTRV